MDFIFKRGKHSHSYDLLISPIFMALIFALVVIVFLPHISEYKLDLLEKFEVDKEGGISFYQDMDADGYSEYVTSYKNHIGKHAVKLMSHNGKLVNQWNMRGEIPPRGDRIFTGDYDGNGFKELYLIVQREDSLFLNIFEPLNKSGFDKRDIFIDVIGHYSEKMDYAPHLGQLFDIDRDGVKDFIFGIYAGYSLQPRNLYCYNIVKEKIGKSPRSGVYMIEIEIVDIDNDGTVEMIGTTTGPGNIKADHQIPYRDSSSYLMVLNENLEFVFEPVEFPCFKSTVQAVPFVFNKDTNILVLFTNEGIMDMKDCLFLFDSKGNKIKENFIGQDEMLGCRLWRKNKSLLDPVFIFDDRGNIYQIDEKLNFELFAEVPGMESVESKDVDGDGADELILTASGHDKLIVCRGEFSDPVSCMIPSDKNRGIKISYKYNGNNFSQIFVQRGCLCCIFEYAKNPLYFWTVFIYLGIFLAFWFFIFFLRKVYTYQILKRQKISREISELQFNSISNQINPHFIFNAMNSITAAIYKENKEEAYRFGTKFANLMREALMSSDKISRSLQTEIDFVTNYLELEKFRFKGAFDYQIKIEDEVDTKIEIPKMIIQTFAENAVKHGLRSKEREGLLSIKIEKGKSTLLICIEDNGIGRQKAHELNTSQTGKGIGIIQQILDLYQKLKQSRILYTIEDIPEGGTRVLIEIEQ
jgi:histidine kinase